MGCDIHMFVEKKDEAGKFQLLAINPYDHRQYGLFGWLAGVRNYSDVPPISAQRGFPEDASAKTSEQYEVWSGDAHSASWLSVSELASFDYQQAVEDRRVTRQVGTNSWDGGCTAEAGGGRQTTYAEFLGDGWINFVREIQDAGADRIAFWFDN
jgi:hypothetical protein